MTTGIFGSILIAILVAAAIPLAHFIYRYARYSPWRSTAIGRTLMYQKIAMLSFVLLSLMARVFPHYFGRTALSLIVFSALVLLFWKTDIELIQTQHQYERYDALKAWFTGRVGSKPTRPGGNVKAMSTVTSLSVEAPTQVTYPWKAAVRTGIQSFLSTAAILGLVSPMLQEFVAEYWPGSPVIAAIGVGAAFIGSLSLLVSRIMAIPAVNEALTKLGLGATPK